jgi:hypothetical protein
MIFLSKMFAFFAKIEKSKELIDGYELLQIIYM